MIIIAEREAVNKAYPLWTLLAGLVAFLISSAVFGLVSLKTNEGLILLLGVPVGSLLMLLMLGKLNKGNIAATIIRSELGGIFGILVGFLIAYLVSEIVTTISPSLDMVQSQILPNIFLLIAADAIFGAVMAGLFYDRKSIGFFALVCAIVSIPFGLLLSLPMGIGWIPFDQNLSFMVTSFGASTGLAIGLYSLKLNKR